MVKSATDCLLEEYGDCGKQRAEVTDIMVSARRSLVEQKSRQCAASSA